MQQKQVLKLQLHFVTNAHLVVMFSGVLWTKKEIGQERELRVPFLRRPQKGPFRTPEGAFEMKTFARVLAFLGLGMAALGVVGCHGRGGTPEARAAWVSEKVASRLELDDAQKAKLNVVRAALTDAMKEFQGVRDVGRSTLRSELGKETMDAAKLTAAIQAHLDVVSRRAPDVVAAVVDLHSSLRPDQRENAKAFAEKRLSEEGHHGKGGRFSRGGSSEKGKRHEDSEPN